MSNEEDDLNTWESMDDDDDDDDDDDESEEEEEEEDGDDDDEEEDSEEEEDDDDDDDEDDDDSDEDSDEYGEENEYDAIVAGEELPEDEEEVAKQRAEDEEKNRLRILVLLLCCCCLLLVALGVGLGIGLSKSKNDDDGNGSPTDGVGTPTRMPTMSVAPSEAPSVNGGGDGGIFNTNVPVGEIVENPNGDTTIITDGPNQGVNQGSEDELSVSNGNDATDTPPSYILMNFNWNETGYPWFNDLDLAGYDVSAELCVQHIANTEEDGTVQYTLCRLPASEQAIETLTGDDSPYTLPNDCLGSRILFDIDQSAGGSRCLDVSEQIANYPPFVPAPAQRRGLRSGVTNSRNLQFQEYQNILFVLANLNESPPASDKFHSRRSPGLGPTLTLDLTFSGGGGGPGTPGSGPGGGSGSSPDTTEAPVTPAPTGSPSSSSSPSTSLNPTYGIVNDPCSVCGFDDGSEVNTVPIAVNGTFRPNDIPDTIPCNEFNELCEGGYCPPITCQALPAVSGLCGCKTSDFVPDDNRENCNVCGAGVNMTEPNNFVTIPTDLAPPGWSTRVNCRFLQTGCDEGFCTPDMCTRLPDIVSADCCSSDPEPTCNVCGEGNNMTNPSGTVVFPTGFSIPGQSDTVQCAALQQLCDDGQCEGEGICLALAAVTEQDCGCVDASATTCSVCPEGQIVANPNAIVTFENGLDPANLGRDTASCDELDGICSAGGCSDEACQFLATDGPRATCNCQVQRK